MMTSRLLLLLTLTAVAWVAGPGTPATAQTLEQQLIQEGAEALAEAARQYGDPQRGAVVFYQQFLACTRCHITDQQDQRLGPDLTKLGNDVTDQHLVQSVLQPSKVIREGFEPLTLATNDGKTITGLLVAQDAQQIRIRDAAQNFKEVAFDRNQIEQVARGRLSIMPDGQVNALTSRQQFVDLIRYLMDIRDGGAERARQLEPPPSLYAARPLPEYESHIDHAGMLADLDREAWQRGEKIYNRLCVNCHGTVDQPGSLPTSLRFASGKFKNGHDPLSMYQTLTRGFGMMVAQPWMVPQQKYDVIHYIRETYLKPHNPSQYFVLDADYLRRLPAGDTRGPVPSTIDPWQQMDYGPNLVMTLEAGQDGSNIAYKGNAIRLDAGPGGVSQGAYWMVYDYDTLRVAAAWSGKGFCDWAGINFDGRHGVHPRVVGKVHLANPIGPGWARSYDGSFVDERLVGRDQRHYGPLARDWAHYQGMYYHGPHTLLQYTVGSTPVLEMPGVLTATDPAIFTRTFNIGPRSSELVLQVAHHQDANSRLTLDRKMAVLGPAADSDTPADLPVAVDDASRFDGQTCWQLTDTRGINVDMGDFTWVARIKTSHDGTILAQTDDTPEWVRNGLAWFIRNKRLHVDIGWVGVFRGATNVADDKWHDVAFSYQQDSGQIRLFVDGRAEPRTGRLKRAAKLISPVLRIGFTAENFPQPSGFRGQIDRLRVFNAALTSEQIVAAAGAGTSPDLPLAADWKLVDATQDQIVDRSTGGHHLTRRSIVDSASEVSPWMVAGIEGQADGHQWLLDRGELRLRLPAGQQPLRFTLWFTSVDGRSQVGQLTEALVIDDPSPDLTRYTRGGPARWPQVLTTDAILGHDDGPFAVDELPIPRDNPWFCRLRLTGLDFTPDGDSAVVCSWDGNVWLVSGLAGLPDQTPAADSTRVPITWRRIASGLFQPLGLKIVDGKVYVTCRDQLCVLHDLNGDGEIDYFQNFNNDHQVTEHFHEFAMGLQVDAEGNFYYAKSARHALPAVVPHHGTLLRVSKDGARTDIVATGFRAANGVCLNPDGSFIVTDQEGHWNPKNRINYVKEGGFYGNMFGYHDVTDSSDEAMEPPLCWITNSFDRSPAELLWVDSSRWGPLNHRLLNLSYGYGQVYIVPHEEVQGMKQGGMCALPIDRFPTGVMRGRFHPSDGQLYLCGMFAWGGNQPEPGGLYRLRYTGKPVHLPVQLHATTDGISVAFSDRLDASEATNPDNYSVRAWDLKRSRNYGSDHYNERSLNVVSAQLDSDGRTVRLQIPDIAPTWGMEIRYRLRSSHGQPVNGTVHNTIHRLSR